MSNLNKEDQLLTFIEKKKIVDNTIDIKRLFFIYTKAIRNSIIKTFEKIKKYDMTIHCCEMVNSIFWIIVRYTNNLKLTMFLCERAIILFIEYISLSNNLSSQQELNILDVKLFIYKKTLGPIKLASNHTLNYEVLSIKNISKFIKDIMYKVFYLNYENSNTEELENELENELEKVCSLLSNIMCKINILEQIDNLENFFYLDEFTTINNIYSRIMPSFLFTDQSMTTSTYLPEKIRQKAIASNIPVYIYTHGAAGGLHSEFSEPVFQEYPGCIVLACSENETNPSFTNRIILGDMSSSFPYVHYLNEQNFDEIEYGKDKKHRVAFFIGGVMQAFTSTNAWSLQEQIIISLSEREDVAMILKLHPREAQFMDLRMLKKFRNLKIVSGETDRSRVTKWSNTVICNDHTSVVFEPMILGKKVVAIEGKHIPKYSDKHSPLINSSVNFISNFSQFDLESLSNSDPIDEVTNQIAWGGNGSINLAELMWDRINEFHSVIK